MNGHPIEIEVVGGPRDGGTTLYDGVSPSVMLASVDPAESFLDWLADPKGRYVPVAGEAPDEYLIRQHVSGKLCAVHAGYASWLSLNFR